MSLPLFQGVRLVVANNVWLVVGGSLSQRPWHNVVGHQPRSETRLQRLEGGHRSTLQGSRLGMVFLRRVAKARYYVVRDNGNSFPR
jgi:hypothetical protein